jgi:hypothetical protein
VALAESLQVGTTMMVQIMREITARISATNSTAVTAAG